MFWNECVDWSKDSQQAEETEMCLGICVYRREDMERMDVFVKEQMNILEMD